MSDDQIAVAIAIDVGGRESARPIEADGAKRSCGSHIGEASLAEIPQQQDFAGACSVAFANSSEVEPTVIVDVDRGDSPTANPLRFRNSDSLEPRPADVLP